MPKISALPPAGTLADDDITPFVDDSTSSTKGYTLSGLKAWLVSLVGWVVTAMIADEAITLAKLDEETTIKVYQERATATTGIAGSTVDVNGATITFTAHTDGIAIIDGQMFADITSAGLIDGALRITDGSNTELPSDDNYFPARFINTGTGTRPMVVTKGIVAVTKSTSYTYKLRANGSAGQTFSVGVAQTGIRITVIPQF